MIIRRHVVTVLAAAVVAVRGVERGEHAGLVFHHAAERRELAVELVAESAT